MSEQRVPGDLVVGLQTADDAAVYRIAPGVAIVETLDFFPPIVDDPYAFGQIAAANAMSDVYAMGGEVLFALNIAGWPEGMDTAPLGEIFRGGVEKIAEAGGVIAGGHTVQDDEPKYGLAVTGRVDPARIMRKVGIRPGDALYLTKPVGTGLVTTAHKRGKVRAEDLASAVASMVALNRDAARAAVAAGVVAGTDITGFGLVGHAWEMAAASDVALRIRASAVPILPGAADYAAKGMSPGGTQRNVDYFLAEGRVAFDESLDPIVRALLIDPQTSGGLLIAAGRDVAARFEREAEALGVTATRIGDATSGSGVLVID
jgi:selenide,water dikinase